ncbi:glutathione S-transferase family protein [Aspergillus saccharolyticus JOP 1030-1]|uniref:Glutathione S-transferase n=1 Tax=Aspergillus saccharolyticus JOP 1030-1 TaxID=1450539 RepID=A0A319AH62_9EURO|nr:glutathione S-transferase [Aspergillus saccharolyticus JOP 1030-1]PYH45962.1 glutathione S-transferase [Aspergillus saccharolyticus JOP 1030-1]
METSQTPEITLYRAFPWQGQYTWSPFVTKLETRLRFAGISYRTESGSPLSSPRGKVPYVDIRDRTTGATTTISDSALITKQLVEDGLVPDSNADLEPEKKVLDAGVRAILEDRFYFLMSHEKWIENYYEMRKHVLHAFSYPAQVALGYFIYRKRAQMLYEQGTMRFTAEELKGFKEEVWRYLNALLVSQKAKQAGDEPFWVLGGEHPTEADACLFGFVVGALICSACPETQAIVKSHPVVVEYAQRIHERFFPDYVYWE